MLQMFKEDNGNVSSIRVSMFLVVCCCMFDYMFSVYTKGAWNPSPEVVVILLGVLGLKVGQKFGEVKKAKHEAKRARRPRQHKPAILPQPPAPPTPPSTIPSVGRPPQTPTP